MRAHCIKGLTHVFSFFFLGDKSTDYANFYQGLWDCTGALSDELSFKRGDVIYILSKVRRHPQMTTVKDGCNARFLCIWTYNTGEKCQLEFFKVLVNNCEFTIINYFVK